MRVRVPNRSSLPRRRPLAMFCLVALMALPACSDSEAGGGDDKDTSGEDDGGEAGSDTTFGGDAGAADTSAGTDTGGSGEADAGSVDTGPCVKSCLGKICGPDGCGGVCGFCVSGQFCAPAGSKCQAVCKPKCTWSGGEEKCGADGCGTCAKDFTCGVDYLCHAKDCKPKCGGKKCGDNGCGGTCGSCAKGDLCDPSGTCKPGPCKGIPDDGKCDGAILLQCKGTGISQQKVLTDCGSKGKDKICAWDPVANAHGCIDKPPCTADCSSKGGGTKQCGDDGCGGSCGTCPTGWSCPGGSCIPEEGADCGFLPKQGKCEGSLWIFCNTGKIKKIDCGKYNQQCKWDAAKGQFTCL